MFGCNFIDFRGDDFPSPKAAEEGAERLTELLLLAGAKRGYGASFTGGALSFSTEMKQKYREDTGKSLVEDQVGVTVYERPADIKGFFAQGSAIEQVDAISHYISEVANCKLPLTERQRIALELLNDTYFEPSADTVFVMSITAVEALCPEQAPTKFFQSVVSKLIFAVRSLERIFTVLRRLEWQCDMEELRKKLEGLRSRGSVRQGYLVKLRLLLDRGVAKEFDKLYGDRSAFVHEGKGRGSFSVKAPRARQIAMDLLFAEIAPSNTHP